MHSEISKFLAFHIKPEPILVHGVHFFGNSIRYARKFSPIVWALRAVDFEIAHKLIIATKHMMLFEIKY